jgi:hypothetical protein
MKITQGIRLDTPPPEFSNLRNLTFPEIIPAFINLVIIVAVILFLFSLLLGGLKFILSGGKKETTEEAGRQVLNSILGIIIVFSTWAVISFLEDFFGVELTTLEFPQIM